LTSSSIGQSVAVYDSKFSGGELNSSLTHQLALIYKLLVSTDDEYGDTIDPTELKEGQNWKGLFAGACEDVAWNEDSQKYLKRGTVDGKPVQMLVMMN